MTAAGKRARIAAVPGLFAILMQALLAVMPMPAMAAGAMAHLQTLCLGGGPASGPNSNSKPAKPAPGIVVACALCPVCQPHTPILPREPVADRPRHMTTVAPDPALLSVACDTAALSNQPRAPPGA